MKELRWCPEFVIKLCKGFFKEPHGHIVIRSYGVELTHVPQCDGEVLYLDFNDVIHEVGVGPKMPEEGPFTYGHASLIKRFINRCNKELVIVNCEAGISRSPSLVLAYRKVFGGDLDEPYRKAMPSPMLVEIMESVFREP